MRKTVKKIAALVAGTTMVGATIMGAMALDLSNYPAPFVTNGVFSGKLVVGAKAATSDVMGAIDIAASLQAASKTTTTVELPDTAGKASVTGDSAEFKSGSDVASLGEAIGTVKSTFQASDLEALKAGVFDTGESSTAVNQYLRFGDTTALVQFDTDDNSDNDEVGDFLYFADESILFEYHLEFTEGATADIESVTTAGVGALNDFESEILTILGAPYTIVSASTGAGDKMTLSLLGGEVADTLRDGETKTYTIGGKDYEVTAVFISSDDQTAKLSVNGQLTSELGEGDTDVLSSDVTIGVQEVLTNQREGIVEFYLGANKLELIDTDYTDATYSAQTVKVGGDSVTDAELIIKATNSTADDQVTLNYIKYRVNVTDDVWVHAGHGVKEYLEEPIAMLGNKWDITYAGLAKTGISEIKFDAQSDSAYKLEFVNVDGAKYSFPFITNKDGNYYWGDDDNRFLFTEATTEANVTNITTQDYFIGEKDYFVLTDTAGATVNDDNAVVNVLRYQSISTTDDKVTFRDVSTGDVKEVYYDDSNNNRGELIVGGESHYFWVNITSDRMAMDLDASGAGNEALALGADEVLVAVNGGGILNLGAQTFAATGIVADLAAQVDVNLSTPADNFDETTYVYNLISINESGTDEITLSMTGLAEWHENEDYDVGMSNFGTYFKLYNPSTGAEELTIEYPLLQKSAQVFVTAGVIEVKEGTSTTGGALSTTALNPIAVGMAVLDTDAMALIGKENLIVVGGPCVSTVAASLMGNPATCTDGFTPGKAVIKLFSDKNALLVAGYNAQDTLGASYVLGDYEKYGLTGTEVEVVVVDINTISVNKVQ